MVASSETNGTVDEGRTITGRFAKGHRLGGRPPGIDFRRVIEQKAKEHGVDLPEAMWLVFEATHAQAIKGDVQAAKLLIDKLCIPDSQHLHVTTDEQGPVPPIDLRQWGQRFAALVAEDAAAQPAPP